MKQLNQYLAKVTEELTVFQRYLLDDSVQLTPTQQETYERISDVRTWLRAGYSDGQVLTRTKKTFDLQDRRSRELLAMAYATFGELRRSRDKDGVKMLNTEILREAAKRAEDAGDFRAAAAMYKEAARIDGAYDNQKDVDNESKKKPTKVVFKVKTMNVIGQPAAPQIEDAAHEIVP